ncbi:uncharacterized protein METZ01_LOCUS374804, partial [marine metagenome]
MRLIGCEQFLPATPPLYLEAVIMLECQLKYCDFSEDKQSNQSCG